MKTESLLSALGAAVLLAASLAACDHLRSRDANADSTQQEQKAKAPASVVPPGDRYSGNAGASQ
jgi:hypothetical protein